LKAKQLHHANVIFHRMVDVSAHELLDAMLSTRCEPNHIIYDTLIDGFCKVGKIDIAQEAIFSIL
jgi:hypothetical protein